MHPTETYGTALTALHWTHVRGRHPPAFACRVSRSDGDARARGTNSASDADSPDTDARIDAESSAADRSNGTTTTVPPLLADGTNDYPEQSRVFDSESKSVGDELDEFVADVTTIAQARCEHATEYADIETLVCDLPLDHLAFASYDSLAPYSGWTQASS